MADITVAIMPIIMTRFLIIFQLASNLVESIFATIYNEPTKIATAAANERIIPETLVNFKKPENAPAVD